MKDMLPNAQEAILRDLTPRVLAAVVRRFGDFAAAEDAVQDALIAAARQWPRDGLPDNPRAWLTQVAYRRMTDVVRTDVARRQRERAFALDAAFAPAAEPEPEPEEDDTLGLLFMCCHDALTPASAIALTLRALGGLTTAEIAHAFLVPERTMAQRISRAKQTIRDHGIPLVPATSLERAERLRSVLHVLYLMFNEGYSSSGGAGLRRDDLAHEAIRLTRLVLGLEPDDPEVGGLLALMLLTDARRLARTMEDGEFISLARQDRSLWDRRQIAEGVALLSAVLPRGTVGPYQVQAAIAAVHDEAARSEDTDWTQILALYELLMGMSDNPMVMLSHAVAATMVHGAARGLALLAVLDRDPRLCDHYRLHAVRAHLLHMDGDLTSAIAHYRLAAQGATNLPERNYLMIRAARLSEGDAGL